MWAAAFLSDLAIASARYKLQSSLQTSKNRKAGLSTPIAISLTLSGFCPLQHPAGGATFVAQQLSRKVKRMSTFVLSDSSVNKIGFRVLTSGIALEEFKRNPIMLYGHDRRVLPIGTWENVRVDGDRLLADAKFDEEDELGKEIARKVRQGILKATSIGADVIEISDAPEHLLPGQQYGTVIKCSLFEVSIVDIPANSNALKLNFQKRGLMLSGNPTPGVLQDLLPVNHQTDMKQIAVLLGLGLEATEAQAVDAIKGLQGQIAELKAESAKDVDLLLELGRDRGVVNDQNADTYKALAEADYKNTLALFKQAPAQPPKEEKPAPVPLALQLQQQGSGKEGKPKGARADWTFDDWSQKDSDGLTLMMKQDPERYEALYDATYGGIAV